MLNVWNKLIQLVNNRRRLSQLVLAGVISLWLVNQYRQPPSVQAMTSTSGPKVGSHLSYGDIGHQASLMDILGSKGFGGGYPVTMMITTTTGDNEIKLLGETANKYGFFPIIRINQACNSVSTADLTRLFNSIHQHFGSEVAVEFGNEINLFANECNGGPNWSQYHQNYQFAKTLHPELIPAAISWYVPTDLPEALTGNSLLAAFVRLGNTYSGAAYRAANGYGCQGETADSCNPTADSGSTLSFQVATQDISRPFFFTEFSLYPSGPSGDTSDAPDTDLRKVAEFIEYHGQKSTALKVTPLVRNPCDNVKDDWLIYYPGGFLSSEGKEIDADSCDVSDEPKNSPLKKFLNWLLPRQKEEYSITPIEGYGVKFDEALDEGDAESATTSLIGSGYQVYCGSPPTSVDQEFTGDLDRYLELFESLEINGVTANQAYDLSNSKPLLLRNINEATPLSSFEQIYGYPNSDIEEDTSQRVSQGVVYSLLDFKQICHAAQMALLDRQELCIALEDPGSCVNKEPLPGTNFNNTAYLAVAWNDSHLTCEDLSYSYDYFKEHGSGAETNRAEFENIQRAIPRVMLNLGKNYRLGIMLFTIEQIRDKDRAFTFSKTITDQEIADDPYDSGSDMPRHAVRVGVFKIPDVMTNQNEEGFYHEDTAKIANEALTPDHLSLKRSYDAKGERDHLRQQFELIKDVGFDSDRLIVRCIGKNCEDPFTRATVNMVNAWGGSCGGYAAEVGEVIFDYGDVEESGARTLKNTGFNWDAVTLFDEDKTDQKDNQGGGFSFSSLLLKGKKLLEKRNHSKAQFQVYVILPYGYEADQIAQMMNNFTPQAIIDYYEQVAGEQTSSLVANGEKSESYQVPGGNYPWYQSEFVDLTNIAGTGKKSLGFPDPDDVECTTNDEGETVCSAKDKEVVGLTPLNTEGVTLPLNESAELNLSWIRTAIFQSSQDQWMRAYCADNGEQYLYGEVNSCYNPTTGGLTKPGGGGSINPVAECDGGARITSGGSATHICTDTGQSCTISEIEARGACTLYSAGAHNIPGWKDRADNYKACDELYSYVACNPDFEETLIQNPVDSNGKFVTSDGQGQMTACEYVVSRAVNAGISPRFALAIWGEESGFSTFNTYDFGVTSAPARDLGAQMDKFIATVKGKSDYQSFLEQYSEGAVGREFCTNPYFPGRVRDFYDYLGP